MIDSKGIWLQAGRGLWEEVVRGGRAGGIGGAGFTLRGCMKLRMSPRDAGDGEEALRLMLGREELVGFLLLMAGQRRE